ncbi:hypothetical protein NHQ30_008183 [Ciborinia camelliae]|nr:hypothetical protein NHQ30_008183 [Ciborinia camelliae]
MSRFSQQYAIYKPGLYGALNEDNQIFISAHVFLCSRIQCPPSPWLPANTHLHTWNIYDEPPREFQEAFDITRSNRLREAWKRDMVNILNESGFQNARLQKVEYDMSMASYMSTWDEFAKMIIQKPEESFQLSRAAMDQVRDGCAICCPKLVWIAQKAQ